MNERVADIESTMKELPAGIVPKQILDVIETTSREIGDATAMDIVQTAREKPINRPSLLRRPLHMAVEQE
jgi:hypothetical protein